MSEAAGKPHVKLIAKNRRAFFDYHVEARVECGIALTGTEVKSLRDGSAQLSDAYAVGQRGELFLFNAQIPPYKPAGPLQNHEPKRTRKLLLHRREIDRLLDRIGRVKLELGVAKGKAGADKRQAIAEKDAKRELQRARRR